MHHKYKIRTWKPIVVTPSRAQPFTYSVQERPQNKTSSMSFFLNKIKSLKAQDSASTRNATKIQSGKLKYRKISPVNHTLRASEATTSSIFDKTSMQTTISSEATPATVSQRMTSTPNSTMTNFVVDTRPATPLIQLENHTYPSTPKPVATISFLKTDKGQYFIFNHLDSDPKQVFDEADSQNIGYENERTKENIYSSTARSATSHAITNLYKATFQDTKLSKKDILDDPHIDKKHDTSNSESFIFENHVLNIAPVQNTEQNTTPEESLEASTQLSTKTPFMVFQMGPSMEESLEYNTRKEINIRVIITTTLLVLHQKERLYQKMLS